MEVNLNILKKNIQELFLTDLPRQQLNTSTTSIEWFERCCLYFPFFSLFSFLIYTCIFFSKWNHRRLKSNTVFLVSRQKVSTCMYHSTNYFRPKCVYMHALFVLLKSKQNRLDYLFYFFINVVFSSLYLD
jgi:hypothetical protein